MAEYKHGSMDINEQQKAFHGFLKGIVWVVSLSLAALIFMAVFNS